MVATNVTIMQILVQCSKNNSAKNNYKYNRRKKFVNRKQNSMMNILWSLLLHVLRQETKQTERSYKGSEQHAYWVWLFCGFCMFITITLKYLMCFTLTKFYNSKYNFIMPTISLQWDFTVLCCPPFTPEYWHLHPGYKNRCTYPWHFGVARANAGSMFAS